MSKATTPLQLRFVRSASAGDQLPDSTRELAIAGRSNVGKSSLINALANQRKLATVSKTPGATRLINIFELAPVGSGRWLVDLPGYGYAKASKTDRESWHTMVEGYLTGRAQLSMVLQLIDGEVGPTPLDLDSVEWFAAIGLPVRFVATKHDKVRSAKRDTRKRDLAARLGVARGDIHWCSADTGVGIPELRAELAAWLLQD